MEVLWFRVNIIRSDRHISLNDNESGLGVMRMRNGFKLQAYDSIDNRAVNLYPESKDLIDFANAILELVKEGA